MYRNQTIKNEIAKRNSRAKNNRFTTSRYLSKTMPIKSKTNMIYHKSNMIGDPLTEIRIKHGSLTPSSAQNEIKIKICQAMNQLNDIDSRSVGLSILHSIINHIPDKLINLIIEPFYAINNELKALCRKELALLIGYIGSKRGGTRIFNKYLTKLITNLSKRAQDCDSRVREACGDSIGRITKQCITFNNAESNGSNTDTIITTNELIYKIMKPIIKTIEKCISPHSIIGNFICLSYIILSSDNYLTINHVITICKCIISNIINIRDSKTHVSVLICIEKLFVISGPLISSTTNKKNTSNTDYFSALLAIIIDGLSNNDWNVRNQSLKAIHSVGVIFVNIKNKQEIDNNRNQIIAHLQRLKYDKISNVRNTAIMALSIWTDIENEEQCNQQIVEQSNNDKNDNDELEEDLRIKQITEKPWFDNKSDKDEEEKECDDDKCDDNSNSLILQQQQLMLKSIKNLESYIHREVEGIKSRIHSVERDMQRMKVLYQNKEWMNSNQNGNEIKRDESDENITNSTLNVSETISIYSDETQIINLNEQLLNIIQMDNNRELIKWLIENNNYPLSQYIDERLMISLIYRITQLLKNKKYINDIADFLKKEFVVIHTNQSKPKSFALPHPLKNEFLNTLNQYDNLQPFISEISNAIQ